MANVNQLSAYISNDLNILISGLQGTGKTTMVRQACEQLGLKMKYYNCSTLDAFTDLIGLPVPNHETRTTDYYRPLSIDDAEVVFLDEINRADPRTRNACFEMVLDKSINGERLPKLRVVVAAMNPPGGNFEVEDLDPAFIDRFDIYLEAKPDFDFRFFANKFGDEVAKAARVWWTEQYSAYQTAQSRSNNNAVYISPRRMEKVVNAYMKIRQVATVRAALPVGATGAVELAKSLEAALTASSKPAAAQVGGDFGYLLTLNAMQIRSRKNEAVIRKAFENNPKDAPGRQQFLSQMALAFSTSIGVDNIISKYDYAVKEFSDTHIKSMTADWAYGKSRTFYDAYTALSNNA